MDEMIREINTAFEKVQCLNIQPTRTNVAILQYVMDVLSGAYQKLTTMKQENEQEGSDAHGTD